MATYNRAEWEALSEERKAKSICTILQLPTHNAITKDDLIMMLDWMFHEVYHCEVMPEYCAYKERCTCIKMIGVDLAKEG